MNIKKKKKKKKTESDETEEVRGGTWLKVALDAVQVHTHNVQEVVRHFVHVRHGQHFQRFERCFARCRLEERIENR